MHVYSIFLQHIHHFELAHKHTHAHTHDSCQMEVVKKEIERVGKKKSKYVSVESEQTREENEERSGLWEVKQIKAWGAQ